MSNLSRKVIKLVDYRLGGARAIPCPAQDLIALPAAVVLAAEQRIGDIDDLGDDARLDQDAMAAAVHPAVASGTGSGATAAVRDMLASAEQRVAEILAQASDRAAVEAEQAGSQVVARLEQQLSAEISSLRNQAKDEAASIIARAEAQRQVILASAQADVLGLALEIARKVVAQELRLSPDVVLAVAAEALTHVGAGVDTARLDVSPADLQLVQAERARLQGNAANLATLDVRPNPAVEVGGCVVRTDAGDVDSQLSTRLSQLATAVTGQGAGLSQEARR